MTFRLMAFGLSAVALFALPAAHAKTVATAGEERESLDGKWQFTIDPAALDKPAAGWTVVTVPGNWDALPEFSTHKGKGWYRRTFEVPESWKGKAVRLRFEAVYHDAEVTLNGKVLGTHSGGYTPFEFDVSGALNYGGENTVTVMADNTYGRGAWWHWGGISRSVNLLANNDVRIVRQHIRSEPDLETGTAKVIVEYKLANAGTEKQSVEIAGALDGESSPLVKGKAEIAPGSETIVELTADLPKEKVRFWHFDHPNLYTLTSEVRTGDRVWHGLSDRFGIRKVEVKPDGLYLNGERIRVAGFNRVSDSLEAGNTEPDDLVRKDVDLMKRAGAVFARLMHYPQAPNLLDYLDEKGMLIYAEIPIWGGDDRDIVKDNPRTKQWLREMVERDFNHPSIIGWSPGNEIWNHFEYVRSMVSYIREELDGSRLAGYVSNSALHPPHHAGNDPVTFGEITMFNLYSADPNVFHGAAKTLRSRWPDKPVFFSEFGGGQIGASPDALLMNGEEIWKGISAEPYVIGGALWTFNDYRSAYKGTPASGNREWGVVDVHRNPKAAYGQIRKLYSPVSSLVIADGKIRLQPRSMAEIPAYTLTGYKLVWEANGKTGEILLPVIKPGDPELTFALPAPELTALRLMTPTGYDVADATIP